MANVRVTDLDAITSPANNDLLLITDVSESTSMKITWANLITALGIHVGVGVFAGSDAGVTIAIGATLDDTTYYVTITPQTNSENIGPVYVDNKTTTTFDVSNLGADNTSTFEWILVKK